MYMELSHVKEQGTHRESISMEVWALLDRVRFARSQEVRRRRRARGLPVMSFLYLRLNSCRGGGNQQAMRGWMGPSKSGSLIKEAIRRVMSTVSGHALAAGQRQAMPMGQQATQHVPVETHF